MIDLYQKELFKLRKKKSTLIEITFLTILNFSMALLSHLEPKHFIPRQLFISNFATDFFIQIFLIATAASIVASEFEYNTIKNLIYQTNSREQILISKWCATFTLAILMYGMMIGETLINYLLFFRGKYHLTDHLAGKQNLWQYWLNVLGAEFLNLWLLLSMVFLIAAVMKKSSIAVIVGIVGDLALSLVGSLMFGLIQKWEFLKWNPINFLNYSAQLTQPEYYHRLTRLTQPQLITGNIIYTFIFLSLGLYFFSQKEV